jgi:hypothetical protein
MVSVIVSTTSSIKKEAFETSHIASYLRDIGVKYEFIEMNCGARYPQPFTASGGILAAKQRIPAHTVYTKYYDEAGMLLGSVKHKDTDTNNDTNNDAVCGNFNTIIIAIENYITENAKDCVCIVVSYGEKQELVRFSPAKYIASFPDVYLPDKEKYQPGVVMGFQTTIGELIAADMNVSPVNWHKLFNPFDRVEQIRGTLDHIADEFKKIVGVGVGVVVVVGASIN